MVTEVLEETESYSISQVLTSNVFLSDFQSMMTPCESHFEVKPKHDTMDSLPSEYNPPLPSGSYGSTDSHFSYQPPGCIPTPVLIAQKIAENQAGGTAYVQPSSVHRRSSIESEKLSSPSTDVPSKQGPPTSAKPTRYPANISLILGNKDNQNHSLSNVNIQERRAQMLANLTGSHPLLQEEYLDSLEQGGRNIPKRSISFKDPTPDKSRMEALSKLGLTRNRAMSGGVSSLVTPNSSSLDPLTSPKTSDKPLEASVPETTITSTTMPEATVITAHQNQVNVSRKSEILRTHSLRSENDRNSSPYPLPPTVTQRSYHPHPLETHASVSPLPEVNSLELNSYGGKSIVVMSSALSKSEPTTSPTTPEPKTLPPALANPSEFNTYGGKSKAITPSPVVVKGNELPDILSSHIKSQTLPPKSTLPPKEHSNYGGKTRTINPSSGLNSQTSHSPARSSKAPAPAPAPRPSQHSYHFPIATPKAAQRSLSPDKEHKRRPGSMFRPQGITVQFSGRGATDESRRDALRKLGLLKDS